MAHIKRRKLANGKSAYLVRYRDPTGRERSRQFDRRVDAEGFLHSTEVSRRDGTWVDPARSKIRLREWLEIWEPATVNLSPSTRARQDGILRVHVLPRFGEVPLARIENADVQGWVSDLSAQGLAPSTVKKVYDVLAKCVQAAVDDQRIQRNPARPVRLPRLGNQDEMRFLSVPEIDRLADAIEPAYRPWLLFMAYAGLRFGEAAALRWGRVDLLRGRVEVLESAVEVRGTMVFGPPKTRAGRRVIPVPQTIREQLAQLTAPNPDPDAFVFTSPNGGVLRVNNFRNRVWEPALAGTGHGGLRIHDLRHTAISLWIAVGLNPKEVSVRAGHSNVAFTLQRYGHLYPEAEDRMADALETMITSSRAVSHRTP